jgi:trigger factor
MKVEVKELSPVKRSMSIEVPPEDVERETRQVLRGYAQRAKIPGFRPGKAPLDVVRARFGDEVKEDVRERVVSRSYQQAARDHGIHPVGDPVLDEIQFDEGKPLVFKTTFEVLPEFEVKDYKGIEGRRPAVRVTDEEVEETLEELRQSRGKLATVEGIRAGTGDVIVTDVEGTPEGAEPFSRERMAMEIGAQDNLPAFNEQVEGAKAGDELSFSVDYPTEYSTADLADRSVAYRLKVHEVKRKILPELDDEFAKDLGEFDTLEDLRGRVREDLIKRSEAQAEQSVRNELLDRLLETNPLVLPDILVEQEVRHRLEELVRSMYIQGVDPEKMELDWKEIRQRQEEPARKSVHARLLLDAIGRAESIEVGRAEVEARIQSDARRIGEPAEKLRKRLKEHAGLEALKNQLVREKSLDLITAVANIQEEES